MNIKGIIKATKLSLEETQVVKTFSKASTYIQYEQNKNDLEDIYNKIVEKYLEDAPTLFEMFSEQIGHLSEYVRDKYRGHGAKHVSKKKV